jgi:hypothetical protein
MSHEPELFLKLLLNIILYPAEVLHETFEHEEVLIDEDRFQRRQLVCRGWEQETQKLADTALHVTFLRAKQ